ncbi:hypothetical protein RvY_19226 [Ramazzottius varieornatus]|uniref:DDE Tnp4 domain-containing protein n=1 Tax=Ramazzottius varieornatus TaxID=947166 RepID=A0A1D1WAS0_RAMVA|nr:hypothetical protein RvY_19226 [Ramazzottius varieornatus]
MPQANERVVLLQKIDRRIELLRLRREDCSSGSSSEDTESSSDWSDTSSDECDLDILKTRRRFLRRCRYLRKRSLVPKSSHFVDTILSRLNDVRFKEDVRMYTESFVDLADRLAGHRGFRSTIQNPQRPVQLQLMMALYRSGCSGNGVSVGKVGRHFGVSEGAVVLYTNRVIVSILSLEKEVVFWPDASEKKTIKKRIFELSGFPNRLGFVDGTLVPFANKPNLEGSDYFSHKSKYGINTLTLCDDQRRTRYLFAGFFGSAHDNRVFASTKLARFSTQFFRGGEYILTDSAYTNTSTVISSYKKPAALLKENEKFNFRLSQIRIRVEHCNGM